ncbi:hypothetical protein [Embleya sp. NBC_00896]|uniref:hypothetical protein n=1 Tax=Embleya sp. NBC_00896 TaxID=2975961 RepID=UPI003862E059|nr:hypothetical protein OG928_32450 [Embleya sp. NBC_00896]
MLIDRKTDGHGVTMVVYASYKGVWKHFTTKTNNNGFGFATSTTTTSSRPDARCTTDHGGDGQGH